MSEKNVNYAGATFKCQQCRGEYYSLTQAFAPVPPMRGNYVELLPKYGKHGYNWYDFPHNEWTIGDNVACVNCGYPIKMDYVLKNMVIVNEEKDRYDAASGVGEIRENCADSCSRGNDPHICDNNGLYDTVELGDTLLDDVLRMTTSGKTQAEIAETCGISVYRVRKLQNGEL